jgi:ABC-type thiamine transport system ATPase subunit
VRIAEDGEAVQEVTLESGQSRQGIVGRVAIESEGVRFVAGGKEDISGHKRTLANASKEITTLFRKFEVEDEAGFLGAAAERDDLNRNLEKMKQKLGSLLGRSSRAGLTTDLNRLEQSRVENNMTWKDKEACAGKFLPSAMEINNRLSSKEAEVQAAQQALASREETRLSDVEKTLLKKSLEAQWKKARESEAAFKDADEAHRDLRAELLGEVKRTLEQARKQKDASASKLTEAEKEVSELQGRLKQVTVHRLLDTIQQELNEARESLHREQVLQDARALLKDRIEKKMRNLAAHVPVELGKRVTGHLANLTGGAFSQVKLHDGLAVANVGENGAQPEPWQPSQLSFGERHQAALAVKIAVAQALAETSGPIFVMLDDSLVNFDPSRRAAAENWLMKLVAAEKLQVILFTCHTDWAADWKSRCPEVNYIELGQMTDYYRVPQAVTAQRASAIGNGSSQESKQVSRGGS